MGSAKTNNNKEIGVDEKRLRRNVGFLGATIRRLDWTLFEDHRHRRGRRWQSVELLLWTMLGLLTGAKGTADVERLSERVSGTFLRFCGLVRRRLPDTTLRTFLCGVDWRFARYILNATAYAAWRGNKLKPQFLDFGVVSMDGKYQSLPSWDGPFAQRTQVEDQLPYGKLRCITSVLTSSAARPCLDASPIPSSTNEVGHFQKAFDELCSKFGALFEMVTYDAGALSQANGQHVVDAGKDYLFHIANENQHQYQMAQELLAHKDDAAVVTDGVGVKRSLRLFAVNGKLPKNTTYVNSIFTHARTLLSVQSERMGTDGEVVTETRYFVSSAESTLMQPGLWLELIVRHWGVEITHQALDVGFAEDDHPWIETDPNGALVISLLRRAVYTAVTLFKHRTIRRVEDRQLSFRLLLQELRDSMIACTTASCATLRPKKKVSPAFV